MNNIFEKIEQFDGHIGQWADQGEGYFMYPELEGTLSNRMIYNGKEVINWSINDYLGLSTHPEVTEVEKQVVQKWGGVYPMGSRMLSGDTSYHRELEQKLALFVKKEAVFVTNFGYQTMFSCIDTLVNRNDVIVYDIDCHACIIDGVRLHIGKRFTYKHNDMVSLEKNLKRAQQITQKTGGGILVITEGVFGMQGEKGKLKEIAALKKDYDFKLLVDDAHGFGTMGATGYGTGEQDGVQDAIDIYFSTLGKSMSCVGAFLAGKKQVIKYLKYNMRSQIFARSLGLLSVMGTLKRLEIIQKTTEHKDQLWKNARMLQSGLRKIGFNIGKTNTCVTPVYIKGDPPYAGELVKELREIHGVFCSMVIYPVVPKGVILLRLIPTAKHTNEDIEQTLNAFACIKAKIENKILV